MITERIGVSRAPPQGGPRGGPQGAPLGAPAGLDIGSVIGVQGRMRLRTLILIRWIAITGQAITLLSVHFGLGYDLPIATTLSVVAASAVLNVVISLRRPEHGRLSEPEALFYLAFDVLQLATLLYLTGGLTNPFAILVLAPVTVSATVLPLRATAALCALAIMAASVLAVWHRPLPWSREGLELPALYVWGLWAAIVLGTIFVAVYVATIAAQRRHMQSALTAMQMALSREHRLSALGALAAAAAHELGSPLATIAVTVKEMAREVHPDDPLAEDVQVLLQESIRCGSILARLTRQPETEDDGPYSRMPIHFLAEVAATPYIAEGARIVFERAALDGSPEPTVQRSPAFINGLGNLVQNATQFARDRVRVVSEWDSESVRITVSDDGPGFAPGVLDRIGEPYVSTRARREGHMGLGIFIAQTLLENTGAVVSFRNRRQGGAEVVAVWPRGRIDIARAARNHNKNAKGDKTETGKP